MQLLVSVRSAAEALSALDGGAALIDVKEPANGPLGRAEPRVIQEVLAAVGGRRPVSAALGEWREEVAGPANADLSYIKWGLAGCQRSSDWRRRLGKLLEKPDRPQIVLAAYADWECAQAPSVQEVFALACEHPGSVMLVDTHCKDANNPFRKKRPTLLDWLPAAWVEDLCGRARAAGVRIALAGSLGAAEIGVLRAARPDWFAVRGAVCSAGDRHGVVQAEKVKELAQIIDSHCRLSVDSVDAQG